MPPPKMQDLPCGKLAVLDLNGTILFRNMIDRERDTTTASSKPELRPDLERFLRYLFRNYAVMVWSSATPKNVDAMVRSCFSLLQERAVKTIWARDRLGLQKRQYYLKTKVAKDLCKVWSDAKLARCGIWSPENPVMIQDDRIEDLLQRLNVIRIPKYGRNAFERSNDKTLVRLIAYLDLLRNEPDVRSYIEHRVHERVSK